MSVDETGEQRPVGETREAVGGEVRSERLKRGTLLTERGGDERWTRRVERLLHAGRIAV